MKHTKNILKSLLITVMALSLLAVSCKKDEGGTKNPVNPTPTKIEKTTIETAIKALGSVKVVTDAEVDFNAVTIENNGTVNLKVTKKQNDLTLATFKSDMKTKLATISIKGATVTVGDAVGTGSTGNQEAITFVVTIKANDSYELDSQIVGYQTDKTVKLTFSFTPDGSNDWA